MNLDSIIGSAIAPLLSVGVGINQIFSGINNFFSGRGAEVPQGAVPQGAEPVAVGEANETRPSVLPNQGFSSSEEGQSDRPQAGHVVPTAEPPPRPDPWTLEPDVKDLARYQTMLTDLEGIRQKFHTPQVIQLMNEIRDFTHPSWRATVLTSTFASYLQGKKTLDELKASHRVLRVDLSWVTPASFVDSLSRALFAAAHSATVEIQNRRTRDSRQLNLLKLTEAFAIENAKALARINLDRWPGYPVAVRKSCQLLAPAMSTEISLKQ